MGSLTVFSIPKPFHGATRQIQRNAVRSWTALGPGVETLLVGDEEGVAEEAHAFGARHLPSVARGEGGTPRVDDAFAAVDAVATTGLRCFVNADIILLPELMEAVERVRAVFDRFLVVGRTVDLDVTSDVTPDEAGRAELRARAARDGTTRPPTAIDFFVFTPGLFDPVPPFVVGRARFDNWLVWRARTRGSVVDVTRGVLAVHQRHDYVHVAGGLAEAHFGPEAQRNQQLAGSRRRIYTIHDASHVMRADGTIRRHLGATLRARETTRKARWKLRRIVG